MSLYYDVGLYLAQVTEQAMGETKNGNPQFVLTFNILGKIDRTQPDTLINCKQFTRSAFMVITEKTIDFTLEQLQAIGFYKPSFAFLDPSNPNHQSFVGKEIEVWCAHKEYEGKWSEKWSIAKGGSGLNLKPMEGAAMRKLDALFGPKLKSAAKDAPKAAPAPQNSNTEPTEAAEEEIPF